MGTPHNEANKGDFAKTVLMPGDPLRSKFIAENFLTELKLVNNIRGVQGYTGPPKMLSVQALPGITADTADLTHTPMTSTSRKNWNCYVPSAHIP